MKTKPDIENTRLRAAILTLQVATETNKNSCEHSWSVGSYSVHFLMLSLLRSVVFSHAALFRVFWFCFHSIL